MCSGVKASKKDGLALKRRRARKLSAYAKHLGLEVVFDPIVTPHVPAGNSFTFAESHVDAVSPPPPPQSNTLAVEVV